MLEGLARVCREALPDIHLLFMRLRRATGCGLVEGHLQELLLLLRATGALSLLEGTLGDLVSVALLSRRDLLRLAHF